MRTDIIFTLTGPDRVGIVEEVTGVFLDLGGNVGAGRMARLGGEFAMLMLVSLPAERATEVAHAFRALSETGYKITVAPAALAPATPAPDGSVFHVDVHGADHEGIIHEVAREFAARGISIESAETGTLEAPVTGVPLFFMKALVRIPMTAQGPEWMSALDEAARAAGVDIEIAPQSEGF